ncbi:ATP-binding protein [Streptomyces sp. NPDC001922]|uniref:ATP-binding protein n=1 Tax=unclassified Streptomyces TaxID=2593676 RepID=UPI0033315320
MPDADSPTFWQFELPHTAAAVPMARSLVRDALAELDEPADRDTAELLTAELVTNAIQHTPGDQSVVLVVELLTGGCRIEVHDRNPAPPGDLKNPESDPHALEERGRGLVLIRALSSRAGYRATPRGKAVWFTLHPPGEPR